MTYATFHAPETSFGPHFNTFLAWVETRGHRASYEMYDVHDVHDLDRSGAGPISSPIHKKKNFLIFFFRNSKATAGMCSSRGIEKCPQSGWGCMGGGATDHHLEGNLHPVQPYEGSSTKAHKQRFIYFMCHRRGSSVSGCCLPVAITP